MYCTGCGAQLEDGTSFCTNCGAATSEEAGMPLPQQNPVVVTGSAFPQKVDDSLVWVVVAIPILGAIAELAFGSKLAEYGQEIFIAGYFVLYSALLLLDEHRLETVGYKSPSLGSAFLVPIYLWQRASLLKHKQTYFFGWIAAFVIACFLNPLDNPFAEAEVKIDCEGTDYDTLQCSFTNDGSAPGTMCVDVVLVCDDARHTSHICSSSLSPKGEEPKIVRDWLPSISSQTNCHGIEYENTKVTVP